MRLGAPALAVVVALAGCATTEPRALPPLARAPTAAYIAGKLAAYAGKDADAVTALGDAASAAPDEPMIAVALALAQAKAEHRPAALETLARARARWPAHPAVWSTSGDLLAAAGDGQDPDAAARAYTHAIALAADDEHAYLGLATVELARGRAGEAERVLRSLIAHVVTSADGRYQLALLLAGNGDLAGAIGQLRSVLEIQPEHLDARLDLARALRRTGKLAEAIALTRNAYDRSGGTLDIAEELFWLLCEADDRTGALDLLALVDDNTHASDTLGLLTRLYRAIGMVEPARATALRLAALDSIAGQVALAELELATGDPAVAAARALSIEGPAEKLADARRVAGEAMLAAGNPSGAAGVIAAPREALPKDVGLALVAAYALADQGKPAAARAVLADLLPAQDAATGFSVAVAQARLADRIGDHAGALAVLDRVLRDAPDDVAALNLAGYVLVELGQRYSDAARDLRHARDLAPGDPAVLDSWGWYQVHVGQLAAARRSLGLAARIAPHEPEILAHLATACALGGRWSAASVLAQRAAGLHPTAATARQLAWLVARVGRWHSISVPCGDTLSP